MAPTDDENEPPAVELPLDGTLDLHTFHPRDVKNLVADYVGACQAAGVLELRLVHGKGTGQLREKVHAVLREDARVVTFGLAGPDGGGWGATLVKLRPL